MSKEKEYSLISQDFRFSEIESVQLLAVSKNLKDLISIARKEAMNLVSQHAENHIASAPMYYAKSSNRTFYVTGVYHSTKWLTTFYIQEFNNISNS